MAKSFKDILESSKDNFIALIFFVSLHFLANLVFLGLTKKNLANLKPQTVVWWWSFISLIVLSISIALASNIYNNIKDNPDYKEILNLFIAIISFLSLHALVSFLVLAHFYMYNPQFDIIYGISFADLVINGSLIGVLIGKNDILNVLT